MEFVGNKINLKTIGAALLVAFFIGRIVLWEEMFAAAIALNIVMLSVSTVYVYLVPVLIAAIISCGTQIYPYGDIVSLLACTVFFLFLHKVSLTTSQRAAMGIGITFISVLLCYCAEGIIYMFNFKDMFKELIGILIFVYLFDILARKIFKFAGSESISREKTAVACELALVSMVGSIGIEQITVGIWLLICVMICFVRGLNAALSFLAMAAVFSYCTFREYEQFFMVIFLALLCGQILSCYLEEKYKKTAIAATLFAVVVMTTSPFLYTSTVAMTLAIVIPGSVIKNIFSAGSQIFFSTEEGSTDKRLSEIKKDLTKRKATFESLSKVYGTALDRRQIISYQFTGMSRCIDEILISLGKTYEDKKPEKQPFAVGRASYAVEGVSGDSCASFSFGKNKQAIIISDGMGKGHKASVESNLVVTTLSKLLIAGFDVDVAMKTVNAIILSNESSEIFASVDLAIMDKISQRAKIFKMGAATTFVKHNGKVSMIKRAALPVGVTSQLKLEYIDVKLKKGDLLIMVSDGVTDCDRKDSQCSWLVNRLEEINTHDPNTVSELIVNKAAEKYQLRERDDLTVMIAAI